MKFNISITYLSILNVDKLIFQEYIKTFDEKMNISYSKWDDCLENESSVYIIENLNHFKNN